MIISTDSEKAFDKIQFMDLWIWKIHLWFKKWAEDLNRYFSKDTAKGTWKDVEHH